MRLYFSLFFNPFFRILIHDGYNMPEPPTNYEFPFIRGETDPHPPQPPDETIPTADTMNKEEYTNLLKEWNNLRSGPDETKQL